jgi:C4-dicarboxylate transporter DctQ subunit
MFIRIINGFEEGVIALLLASMTLIVFFEVVLRFGFGIGLMWAQELTLHLSAWMVLFGVSYGIKVGSHIGVDALVKILPSGVRKVVSAISVMACLFYCGLFTQGAWVYLAKMYQIGIELDDMPIPKWLGHSILLIGMLLISVRLLILLWNILAGNTEGWAMVDEAKESLRLAEETKALARAQGGESA